MKRKTFLSLFLVLSIVISVFCSFSGKLEADAQTLDVYQISTTRMGFISGIPALTTAKAALEYYSASGKAVTLYAKDSSMLKETDLISTGTVLMCDNVKTTVVVCGDVDGDGKITANDYALLKMQFRNLIHLADAFFSAGDTDSNGVISVTDYLQIKRHIQETFNLNSRFIKASDVRTELLSAPEKLTQTAYNILPSSYLDGLDSFSFDSASRLIGATAENSTYSPVSMYFALAMLAESTDTDTRQQILLALNIDSIDTLRDYSAKLFQNLFVDVKAGDYNPKSQLYLANSFWFTDKYMVKQTLADALAKYYYASPFKTNFSQAVVEDIRNWILENTNNLLGKNFTLENPENTVSVIINTLYLNDAWDTVFSESATKSGKFNLNNGKAVDVDYMTQNVVYNYVKTTDYAAVSVPLKKCGRMVFVLPSDTSSVSKIMADKTLLNNAVTFKQTDNKRYYVDFTVPKFDFASKYDLSDLMKKMGITLAFDDINADFTPTTDLSGIYVSKAIQETKINVSENGVEAAAYTAIAVESKSMMGDGKVSLKLDKPFIFAILGSNDVPLFIGSVYNPAAK